MPKEQSIFEAAASFDFEVIRTYTEGGNSLNICNNKGHSLLTCFIDGYYTHGDADPEELALYDLHDEFDYEDLDEWDAYDLEEVPTIAEFQENFEPYSPYDAGWTLHVEFVDPNE